MRYKASSVYTQWAQCKLGNFRNVSAACEHSTGGYSSRYITLFLSEQQCLQCLQKVILALDVANTHAFITTSQHLAFFLKPQEVWGVLFFLFLNGNFLLLTMLLESLEMYGPRKETQKSPKLSLFLIPRFLMCILFADLWNWLFL